MKAIVAERGQVTIPKNLRERLGIKPGTVLDFEIKDSTLVAVKVNQHNPVDQVYGCLKGIDTDKALEELRGSITVEEKAHIIHDKKNVYKK